jgi:hypothetical protein
MITLTIALLKKLLCSNSVLTKRQFVVISYSLSSSPLSPGKKREELQQKKGGKKRICCSSRRFYKAEMELLSCPSDHSGSESSIAVQHSFNA